jgi:hypothetical protein
VRRPAGELRKALVTGADGGLDRALDAALAQLSDTDLSELVTDVGGHDLERSSTR